MDVCRERRQRLLAPQDTKTTSIDACLLICLVLRVFRFVLAATKQRWTHVYILVAMFCLNPPLKSISFLLHAQVRRDFEGALDRLLSDPANEFLTVGNPSTTVGLGSLGYYIIYQVRHHQLLCRSGMRRNFPLASSPTTTVQGTHLTNAVESITMAPYLRSGSCPRITKLFTLSHPYCISSAWAGYGALPDRAASAPPQVTYRCIAHKGGRIYLCPTPALHRVNNITSVCRRLESSVVRMIRFPAKSRLPVHPSPLPSRVFKTWGFGGSWHKLTGGSLPLSGQGLRRCSWASGDRVYYSTRFTYCLRSTLSKTFWCEPLQCAAFSPNAKQPARNQLR